VGATPTQEVNRSSSSAQDSDSIKMYDSDDEQEMLDYALAMSLAEEGDDQNILDMQSMNQPNPSLLNEKDTKDAGMANEL
jgi:hypothetical protein